MTWGLDAADAEVGTAMPSARPNVVATSAERMLLIAQPYIREQLVNVTSVGKKSRLAELHDVTSGGDETRVA
jgi:hypothetical protein